MGKYKLVLPQKAETTDKLTRKFQRNQRIIDSVAFDPPKKIRKSVSKVYNRNERVNQRLQNCMCLSVGTKTQKNEKGENSLKFEPNSPINMSV